MSKKILSIEKISIDNTEFKGFTKEDWVMHWIYWFSSISGDHHKNWLIDQIVRILKDTEVVCNVYSFSDGTKENIVSLGEPTKNYHEWVKEMKFGEDGPGTYDYDAGIAP